MPRCTPGWRNACEAPEGHPRPPAAMRCNRMPSSDSVPAMTRAPGEPHFAMSRTVFGLPRSLSTPNCQLGTAQASRWVTHPELLRDRRVALRHAQHPCRDSFTIHHCQLRCLLCSTEKPSGLLIREETIRLFQPVHDRDALRTLRLALAALETAIGSLLLANRLMISEARRRRHCTWSPRYRSQRCAG